MAVRWLLLGARERIAPLAQQMGYRMDRRARHFRLRENLTIAVAIPAGFHSAWRSSTASRSCIHQDRHEDGRLLVERRVVLCRPTAYAVVWL